jgi:2-polyprenyl-3-methyl-5-hydroxy-6-metoxy-1,4-benzoquinol methylase/uncharacterized protein YbaR (Trm112 family)
MQPNLLRLLVCPSCTGDLALHSFRSAAPVDDEIEEGLLVCNQCAHPYPITESIPRLLPNSFDRNPQFARRFAHELAGISFRRPERAAIQTFEKLHALTARAFGYEWNTYQTTSREEDIVTFFWLTGIDPNVYKKLSLTDVFTFYPTEADIGLIDTSRLNGATVLDVGCGMGKYLRVVGDYAKEVIGMDLSDALIRARQTLKGRQNIHLIQGNILSPPVRTGSMDFVYSVGVLHHTPNTHDAFLRSASLVKPGGSLAVWVYPKDLTSGTYAKWVHWIQDDFLRPITCRLPPRLLRLFSAVLGRLTFVRDRAAARYRATGSRLAYRVAMCAGAVAVGQHRDPEIAAFLNFDWYSPQYRSYHTEDEVAGWYQEAGFESAMILPQRVSAISRKPRSSEAGFISSDFSQKFGEHQQPKVPASPTPHSMHAVFEHCGPWQSRFQIDGETFGGPYDFPADPRIRRLLGELSLAEKRVLELGCLEGGHSLALSRVGPRELISVEGRLANFVRCCVVKNLFTLNNVQFRLDDARQVTWERYGHFDIAVVMGVLYHLRDPHVLLANLPALADVVYLNTHYANDRHPQNSPAMELLTSWGSFHGKRYHEYGLVDPLSGLDEYSFWPYLDDLLAMCRKAGFARIKVVAQEDGLDPAGAPSWIELLLEK